MNRTVFAALIVTVVLAGCTAPGPSGPENETDPDTNDTGMDRAGPGDIRVTVDQGTREIFEGASTNLMMQLTNDRDDPLEDILISLGNTGDLSIKREAPTESIHNTTCRFSSIAAEQSSPRCIWRIAAGPGTLNDGQPEKTYPVTLFLSYANTLEAGESIEVAFDRERDITPDEVRQRTYSAQNHEVRLSIEYDTLRSAEDGTVPLKITVENRGTGSLIERDDGHVAVNFRGTLLDAAQGVDGTSCLDEGNAKTISLEDGDRTIRCQFALDGELAGKTFFLRPDVAYRYGTAYDAPLTVLAR